jgi:hypothetical protein
MASEDDMSPGLDALLKGMARREFDIRFGPDGVPGQEVPNADSLLIRTCG